MLSHASIHDSSVRPAAFEGPVALISWQLKTDLRLLQLIHLPKDFEICHRQNITQSVLYAGGVHWNSVDITELYRNRISWAGRDTSGSSSPTPVSAQGIPRTIESCPNTSWTQILRSCLCSQSLYETTKIMGKNFNSVTSKLSPPFYKNCFFLSRKSTCNYSEKNWKLDWK